MHQTFPQSGSTIAQLIQAGLVLWTPVTAGILQQPTRHNDCNILLEGFPSCKEESNKRASF